MGAQCNGLGDGLWHAAYLIQTYGLAAGDIALPLTLAGLGVIVGSVVGGRVADRKDRATVLAYTFLGGGLMAALVFTLALSPWLTVLFACVGAGLFFLSWPVTAVLVTTLARPSRATATGLSAVSNQLGVLGGAALGGVMLLLGRFPLVGVFCLAMAALAAGVMRYKVQGAEEVRQRLALS